jgi:hypothetical protein
LKTNANSPFTLEQLTTALADLEENVKNPRFRLWYQIPANPSVVAANQTHLINGKRYSNESSFAELQHVAEQIFDREDSRSLVLASALTHLGRWEWSEASNLARLCLKHSADEDIRDEALNLLAASLLMCGEPEKAIDALSKAVEGRWNLALQINLSAVAAEVNPATAVEHMAFLIDGAPDLEQQLQAARTAIALWRRAQGQETGSDDEDEFAPPPRPVLDAIYEFLDSKDLSEEDFYAFGLFLARVDGEHLSESAPLTHSVHASSPSAHLVRARTRGFSSWVGEFGAVAQEEADLVRPWILEEIEDFVRLLARMLLSDTDDEQKFGILRTFTLFNTGLPTNTSSRVRLLVLLILKFHVVLDEDQSPKDEMDDWLEAAFEGVKYETWQVPHNEKQQLLESISKAAVTLFFYRYKEIRELLPQIENQSLLIAHKTSGFLGALTANKTALKAAACKITTFSSDTQRTLSRLRQMITDDDARQTADSILNALATIAQRVQKWT